MAIKEIPRDGPEQLSFKAFELSDVVARLIRVESEKKRANEKFNMQIKECKVSIVELSDEIESQRVANNQSREKNS